LNILYFIFCLLFSDLYSSTTMTYYPPREQLLLLPKKNQPKVHFLIATTPRFCNHMTASKYFTVHFRDVMQLSSRQKTSHFHMFDHFNFKFLGFLGSLPSTIFSVKIFNYFFHPCKFLLHIFRVLTINKHNQKAVENQKKYKYI